MEVETGGHHMLCGQPGQSYELQVKSQALSYKRWAVPADGL